MDYLIDGKTLTSFADSARGIYNKTGILTGQQIVDDIKGVASEVAKQTELIDKISRKFFDVGKNKYLNGTLKILSSDKAAVIRPFAFYKYNSLTSVNLPNATSIGEYAFQYCNSLTSIDLPSATSIGEYAFNNCDALTSVNLHNATIIGERAFRYCSSLTSVIIRTNTLCTLSATYTFDNTPIVSGTGYIYVPKALIEDYKAAQYWSAYSSQFRAIEDYPEICGEV